MTSELHDEIIFNCFLLQYKSNNLGSRSIPIVRQNKATFIGTRTSGNILQVEIEVANQFDVIRIYDGDNEYNPWERLPNKFRQDLANEMNSVANIGDYDRDIVAQAYYMVFLNRAARRFKASIARKEPLETILTKLKEATKIKELTFELLQDQIFLQIETFPELYNHVNVTNGIYDRKDTILVHLDKMHNFTKCTSQISKPISVSTYVKKTSISSIIERVRNI